MNAAKETIKINGQKKATPKKAPAKPIETPKEEKPKAQAPQQETAATLVKRLLEQGTKPEAVRKAVYDFLAKNTKPEKAMAFYCQRFSYRAVRRGLQAKKVDKNAAK